MNIAFFIGEMNLRGVANSTFQYSYYNKLILKNKSIIFYDKKNNRNNHKVIRKFKKEFNVIGVNHLEDIDNYKDKLKLKFLYIQKGGKKDQWISNHIKTIVHSAYPQKLKEVHGDKYAFVSEWCSDKFSRNKIPYVPYIVKLDKNKDNLKKKLKISNQQLVLGCHGGDSSFNLKFVQDTLINIVNKRKDLTFLFLNINKFCKHPRIIFLKGSVDEIYKKKFLNTCDAMIYARSLGESFGLACGEFAYLNKLIISYKFNRHRAHLDQLYNKDIIEYSSRKNLFNILNKLNKKKLVKNRKNKYSKYNSKMVMRRFKKLFLDKSKAINFSVLDYLIDYLAHFKMAYYYSRHKFYSHYYNFIESKFFY